MGNFPDYFLLLAEQETTLDLGDSNGSRQTAAGAAYLGIQRLASSEIRLHREMIERTFLEGRGAARIYAALVLRLVAREAGDARLESLWGDNERCALAPGGYRIVKGTLSAIVVEVQARIETPDVHGVRELVREFREANHYAAADFNSESAWGHRFATLRARTDLKAAAPAIRALAELDGPPGLVGAVLLYHIDPARAVERLTRLAWSCVNVPVFVRIGQPVVWRPVSGIAKAWLRTLLHGNGRRPARVRPRAKAQRSEQTSSVRSPLQLVRPLKPAGEQDRGTANESLTW